MASATEEVNDKLDECCLTEYRPLPGIPKGTIVKISGIETYQILSNDSGSKGKAIVLLTDIFGLTKNPRITADDLCERSGFDVFVPDILNGDPIPSVWLKGFPEKPRETTSIVTKLSLTAKFVTLGPWLFRHRQSKTWPIVENFLTSLRSERQVTRIQTVGYCFGGLYTLLVSASENQLVNSIVGCHVSLTNRNHFEKVQVPAAFVCAEEDNQFSDAQRMEAERILKAKSNLPSKFLLIPGTVHGFASRPNTDDPVVMKAYDEANQFIAEWAKTHL